MIFCMVTNLLRLNLILKTFFQKNRVSDVFTWVEMHKNVTYNTTKIFSDGTEKIIKLIIFYLTLIFCTLFVEIDLTQSEIFFPFWW